jgi:anaerobic ribonucleoside-triphosphate reductase activating protein
MRPIDIHISRIHFPVTKLGPGSRIGIWVQGCSIRCVGCISADTWAHHRGRTGVSDVLTAIEPWIVQADGFTISGGEPFDQAPALAELLAGLRRMSKADILVFTGYPREAIEARLSSMEGLIDALITDPFDEMAPQTLALRGSDNQRLFTLTALGQSRFAAYNRQIAGGDRSFDVMFDEQGEIWFAGIPGRDDFRRLQSILRANGAEAISSQDGRPSRHAGGVSE